MKNESPAPGPGWSGRLVRFLGDGRKRARLNRWLNYREMRRRAVRLRSRPFNLILEPGTVCNLKCPFCPTGNGTLALKRELLQPETFAAVMRHIPLDCLYKADLYNWGEPFLNPHLFDYIRFFAEHGIETIVHCNFSARDYEPQWFEALVRSGLDQLIVSADGATQSSYEQYRRRGDLARVLRNMSGVDEAKRRLGSATPRMVYKMLLNRFNDGEREAAARNARSVGAELDLNENFDVPPHLRDEWMAPGVRARYGDTPPSSAGPRAPSGTDIHTECRQLWDTLLVNANGDLFPCCLVADPAMIMGNVAETPLARLWNNERFVALRRFVVQTAAAAPDFPNLCATCSHRYCTHRSQSAPGDPRFTN
ncbi:MAG: radical SAM protein [Candidatus Sumerlaeia bacterium]